MFFYRLCLYHSSTQFLQERSRLSMVFAVQELYILTDVNYYYNEIEHIVQQNNKKNILLKSSSEKLNTGIL